MDASWREEMRDKFAMGLRSAVFYTINPSKMSAFKMFLSHYELASPSRVLSWAGITLGWLKFDWPPFAKLEYDSTPQSIPVRCP